MKKLAAFVFGQSLSFVSVLSSWGLRGGLTFSFTASSVALINALRDEHAMPPLKEDVAANVVAQAFLAAAGSNGAAVVLGAANGAAISGLQFLRQLVHLALRGGEPRPENATVADFAINNVVNPGMLVLAWDLVTAGFAQMVLGRAVRSAVAPDDLPPSLLSPHVSADSAFEPELTALGSAFVGLVAYTLAAGYRAQRDDGLALGPPPELTPRGAQDRIESRMQAASRAFTAPLLGTRDRMSAHHVVGVAGGVAALFNSYKDDINPYVAGFINGGLIFAAFVTIAHVWGLQNACFEVSAARLDALMNAVPPEQQPQLRAIQDEQRRLQDAQWRRPSVEGDWRVRLRSCAEDLCDSVVVSVHKAVVGAMIAGYLATAQRDALGATVSDWRQAEHDAASLEYRATAVAVMCVAGMLLGRLVSALAPPDQQPPAEVVARLPRGWEVGPDRRREWRNGMLTALADGAVAGVLAMTGVIPAATAIVLAAGATQVDGARELAAAKKVFNWFHPDPSQVVPYRSGVAADQVPGPHPSQDVSDGMRHIELGQTLSPALHGDLRDPHRRDSAAESDFKEPEAWHEPSRASAQVAAVSQLDAPVDQAGNANFLDAPSLGAAAV